MNKRGLPKELISLGLAELHEQEYRETLDKLLTKKLSALKLKKQGRQHIFASLARYALQKGYEHEVVMERIRKLGLDGEM